MTKIEQQVRKELDTILADIPTDDRSETANGFRAIHTAMAAGTVSVLKANELWNRFCVGPKHVRADILATIG
jgi:hypothetical protein